MSDIQILITQSKTARQIHRNWKARQELRRSNGWPDVENVGDPDWRQKWIEYYDNIIEVLEAQK